MFHHATVEPVEQGLMIEDEFRRTLAGPDAAYHLSHGLASLQMRATLSAPRLGDDMRESLIFTISRLRFPVSGFFLDISDRARAVQGLACAAELVRFWAEQPLVRRKRWSREEIVQANRYVRWLRNACHNLVLLEDIEAQALAPLLVPTSGGWGNE